MWFKKKIKKEYIETKAEKILKETKAKAWGEVVGAIEEKDVDKAKKWIDLFDILDKFYFTRR